MAWGCEIMLSRPLKSWVCCVLGARGTWSPPLHLSSSIPGFGIFWCLLVTRSPQLDLFSWELGLIMVSNLCSINPFSVIYIRPSQSSLAVSYQVKLTLNTGPAILPKRNENIYVYINNFYTNYYASFIHNCQKVETA